MEEVLIDLEGVTIFSSEGNLRHYYKNNIILSNIDLQIFSSELVYFIGKVGSGKSSLIKTLYAEYPLRQGRAQVGDFSLNKIRYRDISRLRRSLGLVFQDFQLLSDRSVYENLKFFLKAIGWKNTAAINERIDYVLSMVSLRSKAHRYTYQLSGGEQQRLAIARALLNNPNIILADEPTGNLDPICTAEIMEILSEIAASGCAVIIATHNLNVIEQFPGRVFLFDNQQVNEIDLNCYADHVDEFENLEDMDDMEDMEDQSEEEY
ncbi:MAG: ATP-binding cassette domain-containing protein [Rikenellaceae bacterium]